MKFDPSDFRDLSTLQNSIQNERILKELKNLNSQSSNPVPANRQCPWCGGALAGEFVKCQNCGSNISWVRGFPCQPGSEKQILDWFLQNDEKNANIQLARLAKQKKINKVIILLLAVPVGVVLILILLGVLFAVAGKWLI